MKRHDIDWNINRIIKILFFSAEKRREGCGAN